MNHPDSSLECQRDAFSLPADVHYLNCAARAPLNKLAEQAAYDALLRHVNPIDVRPDDFFTGSVTVRSLFAELIHQPDPERVAIIPSVSYGMSIVARNLYRKPGLRPHQKILMMAEEFPSDVYCWDRVAGELQLSITFVQKPAEFPQTSLWNTRFLEAIDTDTAVIVVSPVHWMYGNWVDLEAIGQRAREVGALFIVDGIQAVGAMPFYWEKIKPDALICASYKWLLGPYSIGLACFGEFFDEGVPIEESWMNRLKSNEFHRLTEYESSYQPKAYRYNMGQHAQFLQMPMLEASLRQLIDWQPERIQEYCRRLMAEALPKLQALGCFVEPEGTAPQPGRGHHLVGIWLPERVGSRIIEPITIQRKLLANKVAVSARGRVIRLAPHLYNNQDDIDVFMSEIEDVLT
ncbi:aminotransferase class V-fold PLP-dependent enzyme [Dyadobacter sp. CY107]|uniref:aminotransferase class V-fold PLP-dependent enzyme n=1 Tax=Dyadobacter fanqingshengii TaxID=2906443 RepID=UPI001F3C64E7|nr:aminotransferase class V-fold PLP-dependent enzyme [Dyadobacter fanqingshengii]MCF2502096.1 aminotransferase class V-fold PLP-dependent enzyme [Dyadobacter fanqingshengii]